MAKRVTATGQNEVGDITVLCGHGWRRDKAGVVHDIRFGLESYFVEDDRGRRAAVQVVDEDDGPVLRTDPKSDCSEDLENQRPC